MTKAIIVVQGAQWGSEGKGMVAGALCERRKVDIAVRTGTVNAGHTVYKSGKRFVMQQLPTSWISPHTGVLVVGPGAYVHPSIFLNEVKMVRENGYAGLILVDHNAGLHLPEHTDMAQHSGSHYRIGATGKGCSHAVISRIRRDQGSELFKGWCEHSNVSREGWGFADTVELINQAYDRGAQILIEGTQGNMLDLYLGPYPYTTHKQTTASQWVTECGLSPSLEYEVVSVVRTYPIRVAGNSGPMPGETGWVTLAQDINGKRIESGMPPLVDPAAVHRFWLARNNFTPERYASENVWKSESDRDAWNLMGQADREELSKLFEFTTVTRKLRRIARMDIPGLKRSLMVDRPAWVCLTFLNYEFPQYWGDAEVRKLGDALEYVNGIEGQLEYPIGAVTTGPESRHFHDTGRR